MNLKAGKLNSRLVAVTVLASALASACGSGSGSGGSSVANQADITKAQAALEAAYAGTDGPVPRSGPQSAEDKEVWLISCGEAAEGCAAPRAAAAEAAEAMGWETTSCDGKLNPATYGECVRNATAASPDAIVLISVSCEAVQEPLSAAKGAGIKIYAVDAFDCDSNGGDTLFDGEIVYHENASIEDRYEQDIADAMAAYLVATNKGAAKTIVLRQDDALASRHLADGLEEALADCAGCETYPLDISLGDFSDGSFANKVSAALVQHPDANAVAAPYDAMINLGAGQSILKAGRPITLVSLGGLGSNIDLIRDGGQTMDVGTPSGWIGWAAIDGLNRVFAGEPQVDSGIGLQIIDRDHNLPGKGEAYDGNLDPDGKPAQDYEAIYRASWGR
ncbi:substrate-binding domain-containing protein [Nocardioides sp. QY071]|uniref:sugar ABC transporter substrate-binding protein n=1 Tax=Nocardioides sp. QY071 TaxID=3044187 RepID=UPI00249A1259|nr:substrate-binding domain-containing protein [Nocardioides sp. QY071]WGY00467.1 substrate-binding domain-containing protein [Nocardioides sp. QY071]